MSKKKNQVEAKETIDQNEQDQEIDVFTLNIPFISVFPIVWVDFDRTNRILAVSRTNNTVELWSYPYWQLLTKVNLQRDISIRKSFLVSKSERATYLVILTANSYVIVYDLVSGEFKQHLQHGGEFAFDGDFLKNTEEESKGEGMTSEAEEQYFNEGNLGRLILACSDGACRYFELNSNGFLNLKFTTQGKQEKATSCCFSPAKAPLGSKLKGIFCLGYESGDIRVFNMYTKQLLITITGEKGKGSKNAIWSLQTIEPHFCVSGTSSGCIRIHEINYGTLIKEFREHEGDILTLLVSEDQKRVFGSGADSLVILIAKSITEIEGVEFHEFAMTSKDRGQSHDIYCLAELHKDLILSAGNSTDMCLYRVENERLKERRLSSSKKVKLRHITAINSGNQVDFNFKSSLLLVNNHTSADLFTLDTEKPAIDYLAKMSIDEYTIKAIAISQTAAYFALSTSNKIELFSYNKKRKLITRIQTEFTNLGAKSLKFGGQKLFFISDSEKGILNVYDVSTSQLKKYKFDSLASFGQIDVFDLNKSSTKVLIADKLNNQMVVLDIADNSCVQLSSYRKAHLMNATFCSVTDSIYAMYETNTLLKISSKGKVIYFSSGQLPQETHKLYDRFYGIQSHPTSKNKVLIHSLYSMMRVDLKQKYAQLTNKKAADVFVKPGDTETEETGGSLGVVKLSRPALAMKVVKEGLLIVQFEWENSMKDIPHPLITKKFGQ
jgi:WD40 repeat protein